jgi:tetratricopeptide (TPR) repeat protein
MTRSIHLKKLSAILIIALLVCIPGQAISKQNLQDIPMAARLVLSKAGNCINEKAYRKAVQILTDFQNRGGNPPAVGESDPKGRAHPEVYFALGTCYLLLQDYLRASNAYEAALQRNPAHVSAWLNLARATYEQNDYSKAARCFENAYVHSEKKNPEHLYYSAAAYLMAEKTDRCLTVFDKLFKTHPEAVQSSWRENYVHALLNAGQPRRALPHIKHLAEQYTGEKKVQWQEILLHQYLELDMPAQAKEYALLLTIEEPLNSKWWKALCHVQLRSGRHNHALVPLIIYSYLTPLTVQEKKLLADLHLQLGIPVKAAPLYEAVLQSSSDSRILENLTIALQQSGQPQKALEQLDRFAPKSKDSSLMMLRADLLYTLEQYSEAAEVYRCAAQSDKKKAGRAWLMAGYAAMQAKDISCSRRAFERACAYAQHRKAARMAMQQLPNS